MRQPDHSNLTGNTFSGETLPLDFERCLEKFSQAAPLRNLHDLTRFLGDGNQASQRLVAWELIKLDLAEALQAGVDRVIEDYCDALPELLPLEQVPIDVVLEDQVVRQSHDKAVELAEYRWRFPHLQSALDRFGLSTGPQQISSDTLPADSRIDEFVIVKLLGRGAFASVYLARQETMQRLVALKLAARTGDESQALARLDHPNIVRVYDQRSRQQPPHELIYMEYLPGGTLADVIAQLASSPAPMPAPMPAQAAELTAEQVTAEQVTAEQLAAEQLAAEQLAAEQVTAETGAVGPTLPAGGRALPAGGRALLGCLDKHLVGSGQLPPEHSESRQWLAEADWPSTVARIGFQLAQALDYAHRRGVYHRDVKPANVLMTAEAIPKLADFNVSVAGGESYADAAENFGGSLAYMSPEQLSAADPTDSRQAGDLDGRSDLYSLAILLWELWKGERPWQSPRAPQSFSEAIALQIELRGQQLTFPASGSATERALGGVLRDTLQLDRDARPATGAKLAGQLRLALYPESAPMFYPQPGGLRQSLLRFPVWLLTGCIILIPNAAAGWFNYEYNRVQILERFAEINIEATFYPLATTVNLIAYPLGVVLLLLFTRPIASGIEAARCGRSVPEGSLRAAWRLGMWAAVIGGSLWTLAGLVYPLVLKACHPEFTWDAAAHFFLSLVLCGGVAWTLPFFGGAAAGVLLYYPVLVAPTMEDDNFENRIRTLRRTGGRYLIAAAMVPLLAAALISETEARWILMLTLGVTGLGVLSSFIAYQRFEEAFQRLAVAITK